MWYLNGTPCCFFSICRTVIMEMRKYVKKNMDLLVFFRQRGNAERQNNQHYYIQNKKSTLSGITGCKMKLIHYHIYEIAVFSLLFFFTILICKQCTTTINVAQNLWRIQIFFVLQNFLCLIQSNQIDFVPEHLFVYYSIIDDNLSSCGWKWSRSLDWSKTKMFLFVTLCRTMRNTVNNKQRFKKMVFVVSSIDANRFICRYFLD